MNMSIYTSNEIADFIIDHAKTIGSPLSKTKLYLAMYYAYCIYASVHNEDLFGILIVPKKYGSNIYPFLANENYRFDYVRHRSDITQIISTNPDNIVYKEAHIQEMLILACNIVNISGGLPSIIVADLTNEHGPLKQCLKQKGEHVQWYSLYSYYKNTIAQIISHTCRATYSTLNYADLLNNLPDPKTLRRINDHFFTKEHKTHSLGIRRLLQDIAHNPHFHEHIHTNLEDREYFAKYLETWPCTIFNQIINGRTSMPIPQFAQAAVKAAQDRAEIRTTETSNIVYL